MRIRILASAAAVVVATATGAPAGVEMTTEMADLGARQGAAPRRGRTTIDGDRLRMDLEEAIVIYRGDRDLMWTLQDGSYTEIDRATVARTSAELERARAHMKAQLEKLPPEQRAALEKMAVAQGIGDRLAPTAPRPAPRVQPTGKSDTVAGRACREFEVLRGDEKTTEVCVADWATTGITKADVEVFRKLRAFQEAMVGGAPGASVGAADFLALESLDGFPVRARSFKAGAPQTEWRLVTLEKKAVAPSLFEVPAGYTEKTIAPSGAREKAAGAGDRGAPPAR
jgi:hypothetical protein